MHFAYNSPSPLLLGNSKGVHLSCENGVRQGDPLSSLLFSLGIKDLLESVSRTGSVAEYAFIDDLQIVGNPSEVMRAFNHLQSIIGRTGLTINHRKCTMIYFHQERYPLSEDITSSLQQMDIPVITNRTVILGAVIGRSIDEIRAGVRELVPNLKTDLFFARLTNPNLGVQTAMILLRLCGVPKMSYLLRVTPPEAMQELATQFDLDALYIAHKLLGTEGYADAHTPQVTERLQAPLRHGGFGITSTSATSRPAYLASVASAASSSVLHLYTSPDNPLPQHTMLHTQLTECIDTIRANTPSCADLLPESASNLFSHYEHNSAVPTCSLQSTINK